MNEFTSRYLQYETNQSNTYLDYAEVVSIINDKFINVNVGGQRDQNGNLLILESVAVQSGYVPKIGDWVGIEWRGGQPVAISNHNGVSNGLININDNRIITSTSDLASNVILGSHIQAQTITATNIQAGTITTTEIAAGTITGQNIAANTISGQNIAANTISGNLIAANSISGNSLIAGTITGDRLVVNTITGDRIAANTISGNSLVAGTISGNLIASNTVSANNMVAGTITAASGIIASGAILNANIADATITGAKIGTATIQTTNIASGNITTALIADAAITNAKISNIDAGKITTGFLSASIISGGTIQGYQIQAGSITGQNISANTISGNHLVSATITSDKIAAGTITANNIAANAITSDKIMAGSIQSGHISTQGLDAQSISVYNSQTGQVLIGAGYMRVDGLDVGVVQSDNLVANGLFLTASSMYGYRRQNQTGASILGMQSTVSGGSQVWKYDLSGNTIVDQINITAKKPIFMDIDETGAYGYVSVQGNNSIAQIDLVHDTVVQYLTLSSTPGRIKSHNDNKHMFVMGTDLSDMQTPDIFYVIDRPPNSVSGGFYIHHEIPVGNTPYDWVNIGNTMYITTADQGDIYVVDISEFPSMNWKTIGSISIAPYGTDNYHGGLDAGFGLGVAVGGTSGNSNTASGGMSMPGMDMGGYGSGSGDVTKYSPRGIAVSTDQTMLYVTDNANNNLVVISVSGNSGSVMNTIYLGGSPEFIKVVSGKIFVTLSGSGQVAVVDESMVMNSSAMPRYINVGNNPFDMIADTTRGTKGFLWVVLSGDNKVVQINIDTEAIVQKINAGANTTGIAITPDAHYLYIVNNGDSGIQSFVYPSGSFIGDAYMGLEGMVEYQGADYWMPNRSDWVYDTSGNVQSSSLVEFHINEPFLNEGGYAKLVVTGRDYQFAQVEQDIFNVTNFSNGNNTTSVTGEILAPSLSNVYSGGVNSGNAIFYPKNSWVNSPSPSNIRISGNSIVTYPSASQYSISYSPASITFSGGVVPSGSSVLADYTYVPNVWFKNHNSSVLVAIENGATTNTATHFEVDELVPKFVAVDNQQTTPFTPTADGINQQYSGMAYSYMTNQSIGTSVADSATPILGNIIYVTDGYEPDKLEGDTTASAPPPSHTVTLPSGTQYVTVDLGQIWMVGQISIAHSYGLDRTYHNTKTQVSEDGVNWTTIYDSAVSGEYNEKPYYHAAHGHTHYAKFITLNNQTRVRYIRDYANGWTSGDGLSSGNSSDWTLINAYADWKYETQYVCPSGNINAGQPLATNGKGVVTTNIQDAHVSYTFNAEFTTYWYMTYLTGPEFGSLYIKMPDLMPQSHFLFLNSTYYNKVAHRHLMPLPPGQHTVQVFQNSGKISIDRFRFEDFQYYAKSSTLIPNNTGTYFTQYKIVANQAQNYVGQGIQSTFGAYDTQRTNPSTGLQDNSVPIKYRVRLKTELTPDQNHPTGQAITYLTSAVMETGKLSTHWRMSESAEHIPFARMETWDSMNPTKTGIQSEHLADGAIQGRKLMPFSVMNYHISPYARIPEYKLDLNYPTHQHTNKTILDEIINITPATGNVGTGNVVVTYPYLSGNYYTSSQVDTKIAAVSGNAVDPTKVAMLSGNNTFSGNTNTFQHDLLVLGNLTVSGTTQYRTGQNVSGDEVIGGNLTVSGNMYLQNQATQTNEAVRADRNIIVGTGLSGGGNLSSDPTLSVNFGGTGSATTVSRSDHNHNGIYLTTSGTAANSNQFAGLSTTSFVRSDLVNQTTKDGFTVNSGYFYIGSSSGAGNILMKNASNQNAIQLDGSLAGIQANVNSYIAGSGDAQFNGTVTISTLKVNNPSVVANLNASSLNGVTEPNLAKTPSIYELGGAGVYTGLNCQQTTTPSNQVQVNAGTVYTNTGKRFVITQQNVSFANPDTVNNRYDVIYIQGASEIEGQLKVAQGTPSGSPVEPSIPSDGIKLYRVLVQANATVGAQATITDGTGGTTNCLTDERQYKPVVFDNSQNALSVKGFFVNSLSSYASTITVAKPIKYTNMATSLTFNSGTTSQIWNHNLNLSNYTITFSSSSLERHISWTNKTPNSITIKLDDVDNDENPVYVDVVIHAY